jgi:hypothetical protein
VLQADYGSMLVAVKLILPPARPNRSTFFTAGGSALQRVSSVEEVQQADMEMCQSLTNSSLDHESPNSSSRRAFLYPDETDSTSTLCMPGIRVIVVWQHSHFHTAVRNTLAALSSTKYTLDGSRYKQARLRQQVDLLNHMTQQHAGPLFARMSLPKKLHKQTVADRVTGTALLHASECVVYLTNSIHRAVTMQAVSKIALSSRVMHPNIVTCQGISVHPASKDLLLVSCVQHRMHGLVCIGLCSDRPVQSADAM